MYTNSPSPEPFAPVVELAHTGADATVVFIIIGLLMVTGLVAVVAAWRKGIS